MWGTDKDNLEMVELLLTNNADPNVQDKVATVILLSLVPRPILTLHVFQLGTLKHWI